TADSSTSSDTPCQVVSSLDQRVTQWMSLVSVSVGRARNFSQVQLTVSRPPAIENDQRDSGVRGVGPADRTGKSLVTYCPGGTRSAGAASRLRRKPREIGLTAAGYSSKIPNGPGSRRGQQVHVQPDDQDRDQPRGRHHQPPVHQF